MAVSIFCLVVFHVAGCRQLSLKGVDIFSGAGGMAVGAKNAGIDVSFAIENEVNAARTYANNHPQTDVICNRIEEIKDFSKLRPSGEVVLFGGPPCQGFSTSNQRTRNRQNPNNWLFKEFLRAVREMKPDWVVFENVRGITETANAVFLGYILDGLSGLDYLSTHGILNSRNFGVPQDRSRLFIIATNKKKKTSLPNSTTDVIVTLEDAISDLPLLENGANVDLLPYRNKAKSIYSRRLRERLEYCSGNVVTRNASHVVERYPHVPQGGNWEDIPEHLMNNYADRSRCHTGIYRRLKWNSTSSVIGNFRKNMLIHPAQNRGLSVREAARIQSFPDSYKFSGSIGFQQQQVGNAVPPILAQSVFENLG